MWVVASPPRWRGPQARARWRHGAMGLSTSWDPWPRPVARAVVGAKECTQIGENDLSEPFCAIRVHCCDARGVRVAMRAAPGSASAPTTMACRRRPLGGRLSPGRENRSCASGAAANLASSPKRQPTQTPEGLFQCGCVNPILIRRGNTLLPRQPIRRTWGQLGEQLDRVVGAAGFVHRRRSKEATASE